MCASLYLSSDPAAAEVRNNLVGATFLEMLQEDQLLQKIKYIDITAIVLVLLFAGIPTVVALAS
jgi:hypothetical protein